MNCEPGDLAIIVRSPCGNEGRIVEVLYRYGGETLEGHWYRLEPGVCLWVVRACGPGLNVGGALVVSGVHVHTKPVPDANMRPLRGLQYGIDTAEPLAIEHNHELLLEGPR